jgi:hypothetical protein
MLPSHDAHLAIRNAGRLNDLRLGEDGTVHQPPYEIVPLLPSTDHRRKSASGYLQAQTGKTGAGEFALGPFPASLED